jgi:aspartyl/asparaginyl-tRNA synthetase
MENKELKKQAANVLDNLEAKGRILVFTALIESELEEALIAYFATSDRRDAFRDLVLNGMTFSSKINILKKLPINTTLKSYKNAISMLERWRKIRNYVAHSWGHKYDVIEKILSDKVIVDMLVYYPDNLAHYYRQTNLNLERLTRSKDFKKSCKMDDLYNWDIDINF